MTLLGTKLSLRYLLTWDVTQRRPVVSCLRFATEKLVNTWTCDREVVPKRRQLTSNLRHVTSQKNENLTYTAAKDWNHARFSLLQLCWTSKCYIYTVEKKHSSRPHSKVQFLPQGKKMNIHHKDPQVNNVYVNKGCLT
jgi:hypothetical protein